MKRSISILLTAIISLSISACSDKALDETASSPAVTPAATVGAPTAAADMEGYSYSFPKYYRDIGLLGKISKGEKDRFQKYVTEVFKPESLPKDQAFISLYNAQYMEGGGLEVDVFIGNNTKEVISDIEAEISIVTGEKKEVVASGIVQFPENKYGKIAPGGFMYEFVRFSKDKVKKLGVDPKDMSIGYKLQMKKSN